MVKKDLVTCRDCGEQFGLFRHRCPSCGTTAPRCKHGMFGNCALCLGTVREVPQKEFRGRRPKERKPHACILCDRRVKRLDEKRGTRCKSCNEEIHVRCLKFHENDCRAFVTERDRLAVNPPRKLFVKV